MTTYDYLTTVIGVDKVQTLVRAGVVSANTMLYMQIYKFHIENGKKRSLTMKQFGMPIASIGYALQLMKREI